jgi:tetratricopeptide (TPR) repeat protein
MITRILLVCATLALCGSLDPTFACIWTYGTDLRGKKIQIEGIGGVELSAALMSHEDGIDWRQKEREYAARAAGTNDGRIHNDYAVALLHVGKTAEAIRILSSLEKRKPGSYVTAVNLGTTLELSGDNAQALKWIREGIRRNSKAHEGTEWLHARILEAKIALARDRRWAERNTVLGVDFGNAVVPKTPTAWPHDNTGKRVDVRAAKKALYYQLHERLQFVKPPDTVVSSLFFEAANLEILTGTLETAQSLLKESIRFRPANPTAVQNRLSHVQELLRRYGQKRK